MISLPITLVILVHRLRRARRRVRAAAARHHVGRRRDRRAWASSRRSPRWATPRRVARRPHRPGGRRGLLAVLRPARARGAPRRPRPGRRAATPPPATVGRAVVVSGLTVDRRARRACSSPGSPCSPRWRLATMLVVAIAVRRLGHRPARRRSRCWATGSTAAACPAPAPARRAPRARAAARRVGGASRAPSPAGRSPRSSSPSASSAPSPSRRSTCSSRENVNSLPDHEPVVQAQQRDRGRVPRRAGRTPSSSSARTTCSPPPRSSVSRRWASGRARSPTAAATSPCGSPRTGAPRS